jgi:uracil-DNA glycosylase
MSDILLNIPEKRKKFLDLISDTGWSEILDPWIQGSDFDNVIYSLVNEVKNGNRFTPVLKDIFNAFIHCHYDDLKVIVIGQDPYPQIHTADGLAFSCSKKNKPEKALQYIFTALYGNHDGDPDLKRWAEQGVLLLNTALTVKINNIGTHYAIWKPFIQYLFKEINTRKHKIPIILLGRKAEEWEHLFSNQIIFKAPHPTSASYSGTTWKHNDVFIKANIELEKQKKDLIQW